MRVHGMDIMMRKLVPMLLLIAAWVVVVLACGGQAPDAPADTTSVLPPASATTVADEPDYVTYDSISVENGDDDLEAFRALSKWDHTDLTYCFENETTALPAAEEAQVVREAFAVWAAVAPLTFTEVASCASADITVGWYSGNYAGAPEPFDGPGNVLAHATFPSPYVAVNQVILHFDNSERWVNDPTRNVDMVTVAIHEIGHTLGLGHSQDPNAIMYAAYSGPDRTLGQDDINGIQALYGVGSAPPPAPPAQPPASVPTPIPGGATGDDDGDGLANGAEIYAIGTDPNNPDTDGDGLTDGYEVTYYLNPLDPDMDGDGVNDGDEVAAGTNPAQPDQPTSEIDPQLAEDIGNFLGEAIEAQINALYYGDPRYAATIFAGEIYTAIANDINTLNQQGLVQVATFDYYQSYIHDIRVIDSATIEVDTCEIWSTSTYRASDGALLENTGNTLTPQTLLMEYLGNQWYITAVAFYDAPAFCTE